MDTSKQSSSKTPSGVRAELQRLLSSPPETIKSKVLERVVGQDEAVSAVVDSLYLMIKTRVERLSGRDPGLLPRLSSFCLVGPTASGKTHIFRVSCEAMGIEMILIDCTTITGTGWKGRDINKALDPVYRFQQTDPGKFCLVLFDEADKMRISENTNEPSFCPQAGFLSFLEANVSYDINADNDSAAAPQLIAIDLLLPVFAGAFTGIEENVAERLSESVHGYIPVTSELYADVESSRLRKSITIDDLVSYGMLSELCGRIGQIINIDALDRSSLHKIICEGEYCLQQKFSRLMPHDCRFIIDDSAVQHILDIAEQSQLGVRSLENILSPAAATARTLAQESSEIENIILTYSENDDEYTLIEEVFDNSYPSVTSEARETVVR